MQGITGSTSERDGYPSIPDHILLTAGALPSVFLFVQILIKHTIPNNRPPQCLDSHPIVPATNLDDMEPLSLGVAVWLWGGDQPVRTTNGWDDK